MLIIKTRNQHKKKEMNYSYNDRENYHKLVYIYLFIIFI